jgi:hypothetical protein
LPSTSGAETDFGARPSGTFGDIGSPQMNPKLRAPRAWDFEYGKNEYGKKNPLMTQAYSGRPANVINGSYFDISEQTDDLMGRQ